MPTTSPDRSGWPASRTVLRDRPDVVLVGTLAEGIDRTGRRVRPRDRWVLLRRTPLPPFAHGTIMFRRAEFLALGGYRLDIEVGEDLDLCRRLSRRGRVVVLVDALYQYRFHAGSTTRELLENGTGHALDQLAAALHGPHDVASRSTGAPRRARRPGAGALLRDRERHLGRGRPRHRAAARAGANGLAQPRRAQDRRPGRQRAREPGRRPGGHGVRRPGARPPRRVAPGVARGGRLAAAMRLACGASRALLRRRRPGGTGTRSPAAPDPCGTGRVRPPRPSPRSSSSRRR